MEYSCLRFSEFSLDLLYEILVLRCAVFVVEQNCPYQDLDGKDQEALHCLGRINGQLAAYTRIIPQGNQYENYAAIGRVITSPDFRNQGLGKKIMQYSITQSKAHLPDQKIKISAQSHLEKFYGSLGFKATGERYLEDDIPHLAMVFKG